MGAENDLTSEELPIALLRIATWCADKQAEIACPRCGWEGLFVIDRSSRPEGDTYNLSCANCDLEAAIEMPVSA
jgi:predicted RNA-binding Zn-ribbon protein involved in translation (DUF1610 family)